MKRIILICVGCFILLVSMGLSSFNEISSYNTQSLGGPVLDLEEGDDDWEDVTLMSLDEEDNI